MSTGRAALIGAGLAVVAVAVAVTLVGTGVWRPANSADEPVDGPVLVALVLPNEAGILQPRVLDVYSRTPAGWAARSVSPTLAVVVSGTSGSTLADAYTFGGGSALAAAFSQLGRGQATSWAVVNPSAWTRLTDSSTLLFDLPAHMEVFDGKQLLAFEEGTGTVPATQVALLLDGAGYLPAGQDATVRAQVGDQLAKALEQASASGAVSVSTDLSPTRLALWIRELGQPARTSGD